VQLLQFESFQLILLNSTRPDLQADGKFKEEADKQSHEENGKEVQFKSTVFRDLRLGEFEARSKRSAEKL